jgi:hypothetical protein
VTRGGTSKVTNTQTGDRIKKRKSIVPRSSSTVLLVQVVNIAKGKNKKEHWNSPHIVPCTVRPYPFVAMRHRRIGMLPTDTTTEEGDGWINKLVPVVKVQATSTCQASVQDSIEMEAVEMKQRQTPLSRPWPVNTIIIEERDENEDTDHREHGHETLLAMNPYVEDVKDFDLMNITITIYSITGVLCEEKSVKKKKGKRKVSLRLSKSKASTPASHEHDVTSDFPTTVAASVKRNVINSQTLIETFFPSQPMGTKSIPGQTTTLSALWQMPTAGPVANVETEQRVEEDALQLESSFQLLRVMMKQPFKRGNKYVENYVHETVHIGINLCRGTELMELGVATLVVTGEEEGQAMMHVPARPCADPGIRERGKKEKTTRRTKPKRTHFIGDNRTFRLDENSALYVGIQVHPQRDVEAAEKLRQFAEIEQSDSQLLRAAHAAKASILEYQARHLLKEEQRIAQQKMAQQVLSESTEGSEDTSVKSVKESGHVSKQMSDAVPRTSCLAENTLLDDMFCGSMPMFTGAGCESDTNNCAPPAPKGSTDSNDLERQTSLPFSEILNVKYAPAYAKSFFSALTYSQTEFTENDNDIVADMIQNAVANKFIA